MSIDLIPIPLIARHVLIDSALESVCFDARPLFCWLMEIDSDFKSTDFVLLPLTQRALAWHAAIVEWIDGKVGLLDLRRFYPIGVSRELNDAAMLFLSNANAIVIDVRENGGGAGESLEHPVIGSYREPEP